MSSPSTVTSASEVRDPSARAFAVPSATFEQLYDDHVDFVWRSARRLGVDELGADDVVQQTFLVVHRRLSEFEGRSSARTWIFSILLRVVHDHRRSLRRKSPYWFQPSLDPNLVPDDTSGSNPEEALQRAEASRTIDRLLDSLDGDKRAVFVLAELEEMNAEEIGQAIGLDRKAVYSRLRAARIDFERAAARLRRQERRDDRRTR